MKSPVRENCTPGSVRGLSGNWQSYRDLAELLARCLQRYEVLKRCRLIPNFLIFDSSVCLGMPSFVAAAGGPERSPPASRRAFSIIFLSPFTRFAPSGTLVSAALGGHVVNQG